MLIVKLRDMLITIYNEGYQTKIVTVSHRTYFTLNVCMYVDSQIDVFYRVFVPAY